MTTNYRVAVPSYRRPEELATRTLSTLLNGGVDPARVTVYIHDDDPHADAYRDVTTALGARLQSTPSRSLRDQRRHIFRNQTPGVPTVTMDDDVRDVLTLAPDGKTLSPRRDLHAYFQTMFDRTLREGLTAWGVGPVPNAFFMKDTRTTDLKFCIFQLAGFIPTPGHPAETLTCAVKDDYEHSLLRWWHDGGILRDNSTACKSPVYGGDGGLQHNNQRSLDVTNADVHHLQTQWPGIVRLNKKRTGNLPEILLNRRPRHDGNPHTTPPPGAADR